MASVHDGHRERLRKRIAKYGFESLEDHEKLEYLLYSFIPRRDTNPIAHELIYTFGSYKKVLDADVDQLSSVKGMTENAALFLHALPDAFSAYLLSEKEKKLSSIEDCANYLIARIGRRKEEYFVILYLNDIGELIKADESTTSDRRSVMIERDKLVATAAQCRAKTVVVGHNHPSGELAPSDADIESTNKLIQALGMVGIGLGDHLIVSFNGYYSMKLHNHLVEPVNLNGSLTQFAQSLVRRENDVERLKVFKR